MVTVGIKGLTDGPCVRICCLPLDILVMCLRQELLTAATGLNTSLIEDTRARRRAGQLTAVHEISDRKALASPSFAVIQALVALLAQNLASFSALNRASVPSATHKRNDRACSCSFLQLMNILVLCTTLVMFIEQVGAHLPTLRGWRVE